MSHNSQASRTWRKRSEDGQKNSTPQFAYKESKESKESKERGGTRGRKKRKSDLPTPGPRKFDCLTLKQRMWRPFWEDPLTRSVTEYGFCMNTLIAKSLEYGKEAVRRAIALVNKRWLGVVTYKIDCRKMKDLHNEIKHQASVINLQPRPKKPETNGLDEVWEQVLVYLMEAAKAGFQDGLFRAFQRILLVDWVTEAHLVVVADGYNHTPVAMRRTDMEALLLRYCGRAVKVEVLNSWEYKERYREEQANVS
jgi:hypothetical protein